MDPWYNAESVIYQSWYHSYEFILCHIDIYDTPSTAYTNMCSFVCTLHHLTIIIVQTYLRTLNIWNIYEIYIYLWDIFMRYILSSVWVRLSIFSQLSIIQYMGLRVFSLPISLVMIERMYTLSYYHHQIGSMNYYPLFRVRSWNNSMRCMSLYILMD